MKQQSKEINLKPINHYKPKIDKLSEKLWKIEWELEAVPDKIWRDSFIEQLNRNGRLLQKNFISQHSYEKRDLSPKLNNQSIIFYGSPEIDDNKKLIQEVVDATNKEIREYNKGIAESNKKEEDDKKRDEQTKKDMLKKLSQK